MYLEGGCGRRRAASQQRQGLDSETDIVLEDVEQG